jgi:hypothetical protein
LVQYCREQSTAMRKSLRAKDLPELEHRFAQHLVLETFDSVRLVAEVDFHEWALLLGYGDMRSGVRPGKCQAVFESLVKRRLVNWNRVGAAGAGKDGTFELLPNSEHWDTDGERSLVQVKRVETPELPFCVSHELDEALASNSRDRAVQAEQTAPSGPSQDLRLLQQPPPGRATPAGYVAALRTAVDDPAKSERMLEELRRHAMGEIPPGQDRGNNPPVGPDAAGGPGDYSPASVSAATTAPGDYSPGSGSGEHARPGDYSPGATGPLQTKGKSGPGDYSPASREGGRGELASLAFVQKAKLANRAGDYSPGDKPTPTPEMAWEFLRKVDRKGTLQGRFAEDYESLCFKHPSYVLNRLKGCFEDHDRRFGTTPLRLEDPVGWMGSQAAQDGKMTWHKKKR